MKKIIPLFAVVIFVAACKKNSLPTLITDKNSTDEFATGINNSDKYPSVKIGTQRWMSINLNVIRYRNGDPIPQVKNTQAWANLTTGAWCYWNNDSFYGPIYGKLYNWYAVNDPRGLAPMGWHIPTDLEWDTLTTKLGGEFIAGGKLKEAGTVHWYAPNTDATNSKGFTGLPGGNRNSDGSFDDLSFYGIFWTATEYDPDGTYAWYHILQYANPYISKSGFHKITGNSIRCIKD